MAAQDVPAATRVQRQPTISGDAATRLVARMRDRAVAGVDGVAVALLGGQALAAVLIAAALTSPARAALCGAAVIGVGLAAAHAAFSADGERVAQLDPSPVAQRHDDRRDVASDPIANAPDRRASS
jgi:hypothetical protein